jgi:hypothetical protein
MLIIILANAKLLAQLGIIKILRPKDVSEFVQVRLTFIIKIQRCPVFHYVLVFCMLSPMDSEDSVLACVLLLLLTSLISKIESV